jgi:hypothetical protein
VFEIQLRQAHFSQPNLTAERRGGWEFAWIVLAFLCALCVLCGSS